MMSPRRLTIGFAALLAGCKPDFDTHYSTAHIEIETDFDAPLCTGDLERWEALIEQLEDQLEVQLAPGLEMYVWDESDWPDGRWCSSKQADGCYSAALHRIWAPVGTTDHEIVHAVSESLGSHEWLWVEGLAGALQSRPTQFGNSTPSSSLGLPSIEVDRPTAAHFVRWLWETEDPEFMRELIRSKGRAKDFERIYGFSLAEAEQRYFDEAPWSYPPMFVWDVPALPEVAPARWEAQIEFDCADPSAYGRKDGMAMIRTLTITERGHYAIWSSADAITISRRQYEIIETIDEAREQLAGDVPENWIVPIPGSQIVVHDLVPGEYELWITDFDRDLDEAMVAVWPHVGPIPTSPGDAP